MILGAHFSMAQTATAENVLQFKRHGLKLENSVGVPIGGFVATPVMSYGALYDDNIFLRNTNTASDFVSIYKPGLAMQSKWQRHELYLGLQAIKSDYRKYSQKDTLDYGGIISGAYDVSYGTYFDGFLRKDRQNLSRGTEDDIDGSLPIEYDSWAARIGFTRALSYLQGKIAAFHETTKRQDDNVAAVTGDFTNRDTNGVEGTITYEYFPKNNLFVTVSHTNIDYDLVGGTGRSVDKNELKYGLNFSYSEIYSGSLSFGHLRTDYSDIPQESNDPSLLFNFAWAPTKLTNVLFSAGRSSRDGNISANEKVMSDNARITVSHIFTDFITGNLTGLASDNSYESLAGGTLRETRLYGAAVDAQYRLSDNLGFKLGYDYRRRNSDNLASEYINNRVLFSVTYMH